MTQFNIYRRKDGRWEGRIYVNSDKKTQRTYKSFYGRSREEVAMMMLEYESEKSFNEEISLTFSELCSEWIENRRRRIKESTAANYQMKADKHILPVFGSLYLYEITSEMIYEFISDRQKSGFSNRYISDIIVLMKSVMRYGETHYQCRNPMKDIVMPKKYKTEIMRLSSSEESALKKYISENHSLVTLAVTLAMFTGLRIGEICALKWKDIDFDKRIITVSKTIQRIKCINGNRKTKLIITDPKSRSSFRTIPFPDSIFSFLREFQSDAEDFVLSGNRKPVEPRTMQYRFARILKNADLPSVHFHSLRHSFASKCIALGFDMKSLSEILGHSSIEITMNLYVHTSFDQKAEYMNRLKMAV
ncbi:site-specific integrase [Ruminococcus sp. HUN007]|uniref:tyrosine-type recombinase/integrase n=1 Tax=Ruminococcus sp. HUN007 TaxID=1514668 RepID=UPI0005D23061|nr:site-specific integrase [Ruminococcus sp. HUN007]